MNSTWPLQARSIARTVFKFGLSVVHPERITPHWRTGALGLGMAAVLTAGSLAAQTVPTPIPAVAGGTGDLLNWTAAQDHQNMMEQLGIKVLRRGPSGTPGTTNSANYDQEKANPYPDLPDVLTLKNGRKVTTAEFWWKERRPEIVEDFEREIVGRNQVRSKSVV